MNKKIILSLFVVFFAFFLLSPNKIFAQCAPGQIDLLEYMGPSNGESFDLRYCTADGRSGSEGIQVKRDTVQTVEGPKTGFFINKGSNYEAYFYNSSSIYFYEDISWDERCPDGSEAFYRVFTPPDGSAGGRMPRCIDSGESFSSPQQIIAYHEAGYSHGDPGNVCKDDYPATSITATVRYVDGDPYAPNIPGTSSSDTIAITNASGAGAGETKYYTRGYGLTGFRAVDGAGKVVFESSFYKDGLSTSEPELSCDESKENIGEWDLDKYPDYNIIDELFFATPIRSIVRGYVPDRTVENLREELALSGYEVYCADEDVKIEPEFNTRELIDKYVRQYPEGISLDTKSIEELDAKEAEYPIWRDVSEKQFLMASLEEYFGFKDVYETNPARSEITTAPINSLLSNKQACVQGWRDLVAQQITCEKLVNPGECALLPRPIPPGDYTVQSLLELLSKYEPAYREGMARAGCERLFSELDPEWEELRVNLTNVPTYFDRAYRYGFIVAAIHMLEPKKSGNVATKIFNFFTRETETEIPRDEVLAVAFKLPDIGTNKGGTEELSGHQYWDDPLDLTRMVLTPYEDNEEHEKVDRPERRDEILNNAIKAEIQDESSRIYCCEGAFGEENTTCTTSCQNELPKALTDLINGNFDECDNESEVVDIIKDMGGLGNPLDPYGKVFKLPPYGGQTLLNLFGGSMYNWTGKYFDPRNAKTRIVADPDSQIQTIWTINEDTWPPEVENTTVDFYIIYPVGFELAAVEEAIKGAFFTREQIDTMNDDSSIIDLFEFEGQKQGLAGGSVGWNYVDIEATEACQCGYDPLSGVCNTCTESVSIDIKQDGTGIGTLGGRLSWWLRKIQLVLNSQFSFAYEYYLSCKTMEEFLLGTCDASGIVRDPDNQYAPPINTGSGSYCVDPWIGLSSAEADAIKDKVRAWLTQEGMQEYWERWFGGGKALLWEKDPACGGQYCYDYIMDKCAAKGINPAICVGMSITESGGLNHERFPGSYDFGCVQADTNDINSGLDCLINKFFFSSTPRNGKLIKDMNFNEMWLQFSSEKGFEASSYLNLKKILAEIGGTGMHDGECQ